jgi:hypothetical protein
MRQLLKHVFMSHVFMSITLSVYGKSSRRPKTVSDTLNYAELFIHEEDLALFSPVIKKNPLPKLKTLTLSLETPSKALNLVDDLQSLKARNLRCLNLWGFDIVFGAF